MTTRLDRLKALSDKIDEIERVFARIRRDGPPTVVRYRKRLVKQMYAPPDLAIWEAVLDNCRKTVRQAWRDGHTLSVARGLEQVEQVLELMNCELVILALTAGMEENA